MIASPLPPLCRQSAHALRLIRLLVVFSSLGLPVPRLFAQAIPAPDRPPANLDLYLLIGQSNMAGRADIPEDAAGVLERCYLLNDKNEWEPASNPLNRYSSVRKDLAMQKLGPGYGFARNMLEQDKTRSIGLIVNARGGTKIDQWLGKSELYWGARKRTRAALSSGTLKGVLWHQGRVTAEVRGITWSSFSP